MSSSSSSSRMALPNRICILILTLRIEHNRIYQLQKCTIPCFGFFFLSTSSMFTQTNTDYSSAEMQFHLIFDSITIARARKLFAFLSPKHSYIFFTSWCEWKKKLFDWVRIGKCDVSMNRATETEWLLIIQRSTHIHTALEMKWKQKAKVRNENWCRVRVNAA